MPTVILSDSELQAAAQAARIGRHQAEADAARQSNSAVRAMFEASAKEYSELTEKLARARRAV